MNTEHDWIATPVTTDLLHGAPGVQRTAHGLPPHRLPARAHLQIPDEQPSAGAGRPR